MFLVYVMAGASWLVVVGVTVAGVLALFRRWALVVRIARPAALAGGCILAGLVIFTVLLWVYPQGFSLLLPKAIHDPSQKARLLAEMISELMNCGALAVLGSLFGALLWAFARWRVRPKAA